MFDVRRREIISLLAGAAMACPLAAPQGERMRRMGVLMAQLENDPEFKAYVAALRGTARMDGRP
jgi:hypothetical protein